MQNKKGFTLIEILVVIAIIGILAATILVLMRNANQKTKDNQVLTMMQSAAAAIQVCLASGSQLLKDGAATFQTSNEANIGLWWFQYNDLTEGTKICNTSSDSLWPKLSSQGWHFVRTAEDGFVSGGTGNHYFNNYYWIEATNSNDTKWIVCDFSPAGWTYDSYLTPDGATNVARGNLTYKCTKFGF